MTTSKTNKPKKVTPPVTDQNIFDEIVCDHNVRTARDMLIAVHACNSLVSGDVSAYVALVGQLPAPKVKPSSREADPRSVMWGTYLGMRRRGELADPMSTHEGRIAEVERLRAEVAALKAGASPAPDDAAPSAPATPPAPADNVVALKPPPAAAAVPPAAPLAAPQNQNWDDTPGGRLWHSWCDAGGYGGAPGSIGDRWSDHR